MSLDDLSRPPLAVGLAGSPGPGPSRSHVLLDRALERLDRAGFVTRRIELSRLPADALLGRARDAAVDAAIAQVSQAHVVLAATRLARAVDEAIALAQFPAVSDPITLHASEVTR